MIIHEYGDVILCKNIKFEDNKLDMELGHPGIVLLPTSENEENCYCLYMTTDITRASKEKNKYIKHSGKTAKPSYINIQQIVKRINIKDKPLARLDNEQFKELLEKFYNYQNRLVPQKEEFLEIKSKVATLLELLNFNKEFNIDRNVSRREIDILDTIKDKKKKRMIYCADILIKGNNIDENQFFVSGRDRYYFGSLMKAYNIIKNIDFDKIDFNNPNNEIREVYIHLRSENYLINMDVLFNEVATIFNMVMERDKKGNLINEFLKLERSRNIAKSKAKEDKRHKKEREKRKSIKNRVEQQKKRKKAQAIAKYGNFDMDFFDN